MPIFCKPMLRPLGSVLRHRKHSQLAFISDDHIGGFFGNHDCWGVGIA
jgi:hypothetical protein